MIALTVGKTHPTPVPACGAKSSFAALEPSVDSTLPDANDR